MGLFSRNSNEAAYVGGKKHWADVIKNSGPGELLIWRQPEEDFNTNSTLIVNPGEEAIFIKGGTVEQVFENGTYKLSTENYPFISRLRNAFTGGISTFNCVVYFVRKAHSVEIRWGTDSPIQVRDKMLGIATRLKARGSYKVQIDNSVKFLEKLVGNNIPMQLQEELSKYFISEFQSKIKSVIARAVNESNTELLGIDARLDELSNTIQPFMQEILNDYGLKCVSFVVSSIDIDDDELRLRYDEIGMDTIEKMRNAQADKAVIGVLGDDWARLQASKILGDLANNQGAGGVAASGAGLGMGIGAGSVFGSMAQQMFAPMNNAFPQQGQQQQIMTNTSSGRFTQKSAEQSATSSTSEDPVETLVKLKKMLDAGLISKEKYEAKVDEVLSRM